MFDILSCIVIGIIVVGMIIFIPSLVGDGDWKVGVVLILCTVVFLLFMYTVGYVVLNFKEIIEYMLN